MKDNLIYFLQKSQEELLTELPTVLTAHNYNVIATDKYIAGIKHNNGQYPLLVAHLDTINTHHNSQIRQQDMAYNEELNTLCVAPWANDEVMCLGADDRAGLTIITELLNSEAKFNVLFTTDEEIGCVASEYIVENRELEGLADYTSCLIQIDRGNHQGSFKECVFYQYDYTKNNDFLNKITEYFEVANGTFTDIAVLGEYFNKPSVNVSAGYKNEHTRQEYVDINIMRYVYNALLDMVNHYNTLDTKEWKHYDIYGDLNDEYYDMDYLFGEPEDIDTYLIDLCLSVSNLGYEDIEDVLIEVLNDNSYNNVYMKLLECVQNHMMFETAEELKDYLMEN